MPPRSTPPGQQPHTAVALVLAALADVRAATPHDGLAAVARTLAEQLRRCPPGAGPDPVADALVAGGGARSAGDAEALVDVLGAVARRLAPDAPAAAGALHAAGSAHAAAWQALLAAMARHASSGAWPLGRLPLVSERVLAALVDESRAQRPPAAAGTGHERRATGAPGRVLATLAVRPELAAAVAGAVGADVATTGDALYLYEDAGAHVRTHVDRRGWPLCVHLVVEHDVPAGPGGAGARDGSALLVHRAGEPQPERLLVPAGEAVVLRGRGTVHGWEPLGPGESRTMTAIGFAPAPPPA